MTGQGTKKSEAVWGETIEQAKCLTPEARI